MIKVLILDDDINCFNMIKDYLNRYQSENNLSFDIIYFSNPLSFLDDYQPCDLVLMDIDMPYLNGIECARKLRDKDATVPLIFITNYVQYAIKGYSVNAVDYVLKPVKYSRFSSLISKTLKSIIDNQKDTVTLKTNKGLMKINILSIISVEVSDHLLIYSLNNVQYEVWGSLKECEKLLPNEYFIRCNHSVIVNLKKVVKLDKNEITMANQKTFSISQKKKSEFLKKLSKYLS